MREKIFETLFTAIIGGIFTFLVPFLYFFFFDNTPEMEIGSSIRVNENQYLIPFDLITYNEEIDELRISVPTTISIKDFKSNFPLNISINKNTLQSTNGTDISIKDIPSNKNIQLLIGSSEKIDDTKVDITRINGKIHTKLLSKKENPAISQLKELLLMAMLYSVLVGIATYLQIRHRENRIKKAEEKYNEILMEIKAHKDKSKEKYNEILKEIDFHKEKAEEIEKSRIDALSQLNDIQDSIDKEKANSLKRHLLLKSKLYEYRKELSFWRDTVRKLLYQNKSYDNGAEELFKTVSSTLKTYQTHENNQFDYEELKVLTKYLNDTK
jgi:hypothetical protein